MRLKRLVFFIYKNNKKSQEKREVRKVKGIGGGEIEGRSME
jgi:hypothetical protein